MEFWFGEVSPDSFVKMLTRMSTYGWWLEVEPRVAVETTRWSFGMIST